MLNDSDRGEVERVLGYTFAEPSLLIRALTHRSYANENRETAVGHNERLEFLGDAVLDLVIGHLAMKRFPRLREGELSIVRAQLVCESGLSAKARELGLGQWILLGHGEAQSGGHDKVSILSDTLEAVIAAIYLDGGFDEAWRVIDRLFASGFDEVEVHAGSDAKTRLQERAQAILGATPTYEMLGATGPDHDKTFEVRVMIAGTEWGRATGKSKKAAERRAAAQSEAHVEARGIEEGIAPRRRKTTLGGGS